METAATDLIEAVDRERTKHQMSDRKFSIQVLGISPAYWCRLKSGERAITLNILRLLMQKLPEVTPAVTIFVMRQGNNGNISKVAVQTEGGKPVRGEISIPIGTKGRKT